MIIFEWVLGILLGAVLLSALARQMAVPYPALLALGGAVLAFIPGAPRIVLEPDLALARHRLSVRPRSACRPHPGRRRHHLGPDLQLPDLGGAAARCGQVVDRAHDGEYAPRAVPQQPEVYGIATEAYGKARAHLPQGPHHPW